MDVDVRRCQSSCENTPGFLKTVTVASVWQCKKVRREINFQIEIKLNLIKAKQLYI